jgi:nucleosome binding factor SPN SPT16 subunit
MIRLPDVANDKFHIQDLQFYREASDVQFDETGNRKRKYRYGGEDEIEMEQQEQKRRQILNKEFKSFSERIAEARVSFFFFFGKRLFRNTDSTIQC